MATTKQRLPGGAHGTNPPQVVEDFLFVSRCGFQYTTLQEQLDQNPRDRYHQTQAFPHPDEVTAQDWDRAFNSADTRVYHQFSAEGEKRSENAQYFRICTYDTREVAEKILRKRLIDAGDPLPLSAGRPSNLPDSTKGKGKEEQPERQQTDISKIIKMSRKPSPAGSPSPSSPTASGKPQTGRKSKAGPSKLGKQIPSREGSASESSDDGEYCYCKGPDRHTPMVCCDKCSNWYHVECMDEHFHKKGQQWKYKVGKMTDLINTFLCGNCTDSKLQQITWVLKCLVEGCFNRARGEEAEEAQKFCTIEHMEEYARGFIENIIAADEAREAQGIMPTPGGALTFEQTAHVLSETTFEEFQGLGRRAPELSGPGTKRQRRDKMLGDLFAWAYGGYEIHTTLDKFRREVPRLDGKGRQMPVYLTEKNAEGEDVLILDEAGEPQTIKLVSTKYREMEGWNSGMEVMPFEQVTADFDWEALLNWEQKAKVKEWMVKMCTNRDRMVGYEALGVLLKMIRRAHVDAQASKKIKDHNGKIQNYSSICGFDPRMTWTPQDVLEFRHIPEGKEAFRAKEISGDSKNNLIGIFDKFVDGICTEIKAKGRGTTGVGCSRHIDWMRVQEDDWRMETDKRQAAEEKLMDQIFDILAQGEEKAASKDHESHWFRTIVYENPPRSEGDSSDRKPVIKSVRTVGQEWYYDGDDPEVDAFIAKSFSKLHTKVVVDDDDYMADD